MVMPNTCWDNIPTSVRTCNPVCTSVQPRTLPAHFTRYPAQVNLSKVVCPRRVRADNDVEEGINIDDEYDNCTIVIGKRNGKSYVLDALCEPWYAEMQLQQQQENGELDWYYFDTDYFDLYPYSDSEPDLDSDCM
jgi:hypothetical protein